MNFCNCPNCRTENCPNAEKEKNIGGYVCRLCGIARPKSWYIYEAKKGSEWLTPCCANCAREAHARGPFAQHWQPAPELPKKEGT